MAKRLTEIQKDQIVKSFLDGINIELLSRKFNCTQLTVVRNLKKNLGEIKYKELTKKNKSLKVDLDKNNEKNSASNKKHDLESVNKDLDNTNQFQNVSNSDFIPIDSFLEIAPVDYEIDNLSRKELSSVSISEIDFPKVVYMIVDKKNWIRDKITKRFFRMGILTSWWFE